MNMPGFTAEASFYEANRRYYMAGISCETEEAVYPAQTKVCDKYCLRDCRYGAGCVAECGTNPQSPCFRSCMQSCLDACCYTHWPFPFP